MRKSILQIVVFISLIALAGCHKDPLNHLSNSETMVYVTNRDSTVDFGSYKTFSIADSADVVENGQLVGRIQGPFESALISAIDSVMEQRGYTLVSKSDQPDLAITITELTNITTGYVDYSAYWDAYNGYWDPYYWGYPGYGYYSPYAFGVYSVQNNSLEIDMLDLKNASANGDQIVSVWSGLSAGALVFDPSYATTQVQNLFTQSSYIKAD
jgi:Domain of unknown function (DUF4136)